MGHESDWEIDLKMLEMRSFDFLSGYVGYGSFDHYERHDNKKMGNGRKKSAEELKPGTYPAH